MANIAPGATEVHVYSITTLVASASKRETPSTAATTETVRGETLRTLLKRVFETLICVSHLYRNRHSVTGRCVDDTEVQRKLKNEEAKAPVSKDGKRGKQMNEKIPESDQTGNNCKISTKTAKHEGGQGDCLSVWFLWC